MIFVELAPPDELPSIREITQPQLLRLAVARAYGAGTAIPVSVAEAMVTLRRNRPTVLAFFSLEALAEWAAQYGGPNAEAVRYIVRDYVAAKSAARPADFDPELYEAVHVQCD